MATSSPKLNSDVLQREVVATAAHGFGTRRLPDISYDDATEFQANARTYEQIARDPEASAALQLIVLMVLADGIQLSPAVSEKHEKYARAVEIKEHLERTLAGLNRTLAETLEMMLRPCLTFGNKIAEKVYDIPTSGPDAYRLVLKALKVKPRGSVSFVVDEYWNLVGLVPARFVVGSGLSDSARVIPPEKFVVMTFRMQDEDPRGQSIYKPIVKPWHVKQLTWPEFLTYLMRCAVPGLVLVLGENVKDQIKRTAEGTPEIDSAGQVVKVSAIDQYLNAAKEFRNSFGMALEHGSEVKILEVRSNGEVFDLAFAKCNQEITKGILLQALATADAEHQTKGSTSEQMGVVELLVWSIKRWVGEAIVRRQILQAQVEYNFGEEDAREFTPVVSCGDYERRDWATDSAAVVALVTATAQDEDGNRVSALTYSQIQSLLTQIGIQAPSEDEVKAMRERKAKMQAEKQKQPGEPDKALDQQEKKAA